MAQFLDIPDDILIDMLSSWNIKEILLLRSSCKAMKEKVINCLTNVEMVCPDPSRRHPHFRFEPGHFLYDLLLSRSKIKRLLPPIKISLDVLSQLVTKFLYLEELELFKVSNIKPQELESILAHVKGTLRTLRLAPTSMTQPAADQIAAVLAQMPKLAVLEIIVHGSFNWENSMLRYDKPSPTLWSLHGCTLRELTLRGVKLDAKSGDCLENLDFLSLEFSGMIAIMNVPEAKFKSLRRLQLLHTMLDVASADWLVKVLKGIPSGQLRSILIEGLHGNRTWKKNLIQSIDSLQIVPRRLRIPLLQPRWVWNKDTSSS